MMRNHFGADSQSDFDTSMEFDFIANVKNLGDFNARRSRWPAENLPLIFLKVFFCKS